MDCGHTWTEPNCYRVRALSEVLAIDQMLRVPVCTIPLYPTSEMGPVTAMVKPLPFNFLNSFAHWAGFKGTFFLLIATFLPLL